jgi:alkylation response protein AidB-like acyl-CoA dehydrogenase
MTRIAPELPLPQPRLFDGALSGAIEGFLESFRPRLRLGRCDLREAIRWFHAPTGPLAPGASACEHPRAVARVLATVAWSDLSVAFSLWSHRMVIEYLRAADEARPARREWLPRLETAEVMGSTALAAAMAHQVAGTALPIAGRGDADPASSDARGLALTGHLRWASNLFGVGFLLVTAAEVSGRGPLVVALPGALDGLEIEPYPDLLDLQSTQSSSIRLSRAHVGEWAVLAEPLDAFIRRVRPTFLLFQASFCWGLAARALLEAAARMTRGTNHVFGAEQRVLEEERARVEQALLARLDDVAAVAGVAPETTRSPPPSSPSAMGASLPMVELVRLRLDAARLATSATRLESKVVGGSGYARGSQTARRLREAAFLPIQSPTEGQLLWELSRSA